MKRSEFTEEQTAFALKQAESGVTVAEVCRKMGISENTYYAWKKKFSGLGVSELRRLRQLEEDTLFAYLQESAKARLIKARELAKAGELLSATTHGMDRATLFTPWVGTRAYQTLKYRLRARLGAKCVNDDL